MLGRQAADLFQEGAAEGSHIGIAAGIGDHGEGIIRIAHEKPGLGNAVGIDILPEIDMHLFSKKMGQMGNADAKGMGDGFQSNLLTEMIGNIAHDPMTETAVAVIVDRMIGKTVHGGGQEHMQIGDAEGEMILHVQRLQAVESQRGIFRRVRGAELLHVCVRAEYRAQYHSGGGAYAVCG